MSSTHLYSTLPSHESIRLLYLQSSVEENSVTCSLAVINSYKSAPKYHALSYCWGDANDTINLSCNGTSFPVTKSLHAALCRVREKGLPQPIWADAICINQKNILERNQQIAIMRQIYLRASRIFIWIGHGDEYSVPAMNVIRSIGHGCCLELYGPDPSPVSWLVKLHKETDRTQAVLRTNHVDLKDISYMDWVLIGHFYNFDWFFRVWVIQEVQGSQRIHLLCGKEEIEWDFVALAANWICHGDHRDRTIHWRKDCFPSLGGFHNAFFMWEQSLSTRREAPFLALLHFARNFRATDPRDKVFALLQHPIMQIQIHEQKRGISIKHPSDLSSTAPATHLGFQADYNMNTCEVYRKVALDSIRCYCNLEVLCYAWETAYRDEFNPSWIPTWGVTNNFNNYAPLLPFLYNAAGGTSPRLQPTSEKTTLILQGLYLGPIVKTCSVLRFGDEQCPSDYARKEENIRNNLITMSKIIVQDRWQKETGLENTAERAYKSFEAHFADFSSYLLPLLKAHRQDSYIPLSTIWCDGCRQYISKRREPTSKLPKLYKCLICSLGDFVLCTNCYDSGIRCKSGKHTLKSSTATSVWCPYTDEIVNQLKPHASTGDGDRFFNTARTSCRNNVFFDTSQGWRGIGSQNIEPGDILVILFGSRVPFILRRFEMRYRLVADCYVYDLMDGEAIQMWKSGKLNVEDFIIY